MHDSQGQGRAEAAPESDPFGETTDPAIYVARDLTEAVLETVDDTLDRARIAAILGPPGIGKTLLLRLAAARACQREEARDGVEVRVVDLPYSAVDFDDWCAWVVGLLAAPPVSDPEAALRAWLDTRRSAGTRLLVAMDEAGALPLDTARSLVKLTAETGRGLRLLLAATEDAQASRMLAALGETAESVRLTTPMTARETGSYVLGRLSATAAPYEITARFDAEALHWIHTVSAGIPRRVHEIALHLIEAPPPDVSRSWWEERWLGAPIDEAHDAVLDLDESLSGSP